MQESRSAGIAHSTLRRYFSLLEALFILQPLPAWSTNLGKRLVKAPKLHLNVAELVAQASRRAVLAVVHVVRARA